MVSITYKVGWNDVVNGITGNKTNDLIYINKCLGISYRSNSPYFKGVRDCCKRYQSTLNQPNKLPYND